jgi:hypothetical protein
MPDFMSTSLLGMKRRRSSRTRQIGVIPMARFAATLARSVDAPPLGRGQSSSHPQIDGTRIQQPSAGKRLYGNERPVEPMNLSQ